MTLQFSCLGFCLFCLHIMPGSSSSCCMLCTALPFLLVLPLHTFASSIDVIQLPTSVIFLAICWALYWLVDHSAVIISDDLSFWYVFHLLVFVFFTYIFILCLVYDIKFIFCLLSLLALLSVTSGLPPFCPTGELVQILLQQCLSLQLTL